MLSAVIIQSGIHCRFLRQFATRITRLARAKPCFSHFMVGWGLIVLFFKFTPKPGGQAICRLTSFLLFALSYTLSNFPLGVEIPVSQLGEK